MHNHMGSEPACFEISCDPVCGASECTMDIYINNIYIKKMEGHTSDILARDFVECRPG